MASKWRILDFSSFEGSLSSIRGGISVTPQEGCPTDVPIADVAVVVIGTHVSLSTAVLHRLCSADIAVLFCDWRGVPEGAAYSWSDHGRVGARHRAQAELSAPRRKNAWGRIVRAKVLGQSAVLKSHGIPGAGELHALADQVRSGDPTNVEAQAARLYWSRYFNGRSGRSPSSGELLGQNPCLDYGYTVLRGFVIRGILGAGLSGPLGLFHHGRSNMFALADDLIEPFRPCIDDAVLELSPDASPSDSEVKRRLVAAATQPFDESGVRIPATLEAFAQQFGRYVEGDLQRLIPPVWSGPIRSE